jgi:hypothetical protein
MKKILLLLTLILISCERDVDYDMPFKEEVVIQSVLNSDMPLGATTNGFLSFVHIGKTINPLQELDTNNAFIKNAIVTIISDNESYTLNYDSLGYWTNSSFIPKVGKNYRIEVFHNGQTTFAETLIPEVNYNIFDIKAKVSSERMYENIYYFDFIFDIELKIDNQNFTFLTSDYNLIENKLEDFYGKYFTSYKLYSQDDKRNNIVRFPYITYEYTDISKNDEIEVNFLLGLDFFDPQIRLYWKTKDNGNEETGFFGGGGQNIQGNVKNGIGYFFGNNAKIEAITYTHKINN